MIRGRYLAILLHREILRFLANPGMWVLLILFFCMGVLISLSDVILQRDTFNILLRTDEPSEFMDFFEAREPHVTVYRTGEVPRRGRLNRLVFLDLAGGDFDATLEAGEKPSVEISSPNLSRTELSRLRDLLVKNAFLFLGVETPLEVQLAPMTGRSAGTESVLDKALQPVRSQEEFKRLIMGLLLTISLNIMCFNLLTVSLAEEKQSKTLLALLLTPARSAEVAVAKGLFFLFPGLALTGAMTGIYRPDLLTHPVLWITLVCGALLYISLAITVAGFVEKQSTASLICLGYLFFLTSMFILAPRFTALYAIKNHLPENFIFSTLSFLFDGTPFRVYASFFYAFVGLSLAAPFVAVTVFTRRTEARPPVAESRSRHWTIKDCVLIFGLCLLFHFFLTPALIRVLHAVTGAAHKRMLGVLILYLAVFAVPLALILPVYARVKFRQGLLRLTLKTHRPWLDFRLGALWFLAYMASLLLAVWVLVTACRPGLSGSDLSLLERINPKQMEFLKTAMHFMNHLGVSGWVILALVLGLFVPFLEEVYFRGCILSALEHRWSRKVALAGSAALFALLHMNPLLFPLYFLLGILTGLLYLRTGNLVAPITFHALNNLVSVGVLVAALK